jgi:hypothetical protein
MVGCKVRFKDFESGPVETGKRDISPESGAQASPEDSKAFGLDEGFHVFCGGCVGRCAEF